MKEYNGCLFVEVPEDGEKFVLALHDGLNIVFDFKEGGHRGFIEIPENPYEIVGLAKDLTDEQMAEIVESWDSPTSGDDYQDYYKNYEIETDENRMYLMDFTDVDKSFASLLKSFNMQPETTLILKIKNDGNNH